MIARLIQTIAMWRSGSEKGATAVEYGLIVALIAVVIIIAVALLGTNLDAIFNFIANRIGEEVPG